MSTRRERARRFNFWRRCRNCGEKNVRHLDPFTKTYICKPTDLWDRLSERDRDTP